MINLFGFLGVFFFLQYTFTSTAIFAVQIKKYMIMKPYNVWCILLFGEGETRRKLVNITSFVL
ncbi:hypothetical protein HanIR_Chr16g0832111 [Helianthus annuus]|nr:hypothetical protein HanIR_Chr16g0832111 [Helianthus annuus]